MARTRRMADRTPKMDTFTRQYIETALWSSNDNADDSGGEPLDANYSISDIDPATLKRMIQDCADFQKDFGDLIDDDGGDYSQAGHDFWLTRNGHGAGFWDGDWEKHGDELTEASKDFGEYYLHVGDDGVIYGDTSGGYRYNPGYDPRTRKAPSTAQAPRVASGGGRWTVEPGRELRFDGRPFIRVDPESGYPKSGAASPAEADGAARVIARLFNQNGITPDTIFESHMGVPRRRR